MLRGFFFAVMTIATWIGVQILFLHLFKKTKHRFRLKQTLYLTSLVCYTLLAWPLDPFSFLNGLLLQILLFLSFLVVFYAIARPISLRLLVELDKSPEKALTLDEIQLKYNLKYIIESRLSALSYNHCIAEKGGRYFLTDKGRWMGKFFSWGRQLYGKCQN